MTHDEFQALCTPRNIRLLTPFSGVKKKTTFECLICGHQWITVPDSIKRGSGCPQCAGSIPVTAEMVQELLAKKGYFLVSGYVNTQTRCFMRCDKGHEFEGIPSQVTRKIGCPFCAGRRQTKETINAELASQENGIQMKGDYHGQRKKTEFICMNGHTWFAVPMNIQRGIGCPHCSGNARMNAADINLRLAAAGRDIRMINEPVYGSRRGLFECPKGHQWEANIHAVTTAGTGCSVCAGHGKNRDDVNAIIKSRGLELLDDFKRLKDKRQFKCAHGHEWEAQISSVKDGGGCPWCSNQVTYTREMFLETIADRTDLQMTGIYNGLGEKTEFTCKAEGHTWQTEPKKIKAGGGCPRCQGKYQTLEEVNVALSVRGIRIIADFTNVSSKALFEADCGHQWKAQVHEVYRQGTGCPKCATGGIGSMANAFVYVMDFGNGIVKIGSSGVVETRLKRLREQTPVHISSHIEISALYQFDDGSGLAAYAAEKAAHRRLKKYKAGLTGFPGSTELFRISVADACQLLWELGGKASTIVEVTGAQSCKVKND